jgi:L-lactate dehydrogenase
MRRPKILIVGAGMVGGAAALFCAATIPSAEVVILDLERVRSDAQALDLAHATAFWGHDRVHAGDWSAATDADIVVVTAGAGVKAGQTRLDLAQTNAVILDDIADRIAPVAATAIWIVATNPCDALAAHLRVRLSSAPERIISSGTTLDTARLRALLSPRLGVAAPAIEAYVIGEHGESALVHWSGASVAGMPLELFLSRVGRQLGPASRDFLLRSVHTAAAAIKEGKGATYYGIGSAVARICHAIVHDSNAILSVGVVHPEVEGVSDVCVSLPMLIDSRGAHLVAYPELTADEHVALRASASVVKEATDSIARPLPEASTRRGTRRP